MGWMIAGIGAIALPVVAHLLSRRGGRTVVFPAVRFVMRAAAEHARRHRLRDILLLLMRVAAIALIALAFDRPVWLTEAARGADARAGRNVVIVLDASASMGRTERGRTLYDAARDRAVQVLEELDWSRDRAGVVFIRAGALAALPRLSGNRDALAARLRESSVTLERGDLSGALALAATMPGALDIDGTKPRVRRIVVIGDHQRTQWEEGEAPVGAEAVFSGIGPVGPTPNLAVADVAVAGGRALVGRDLVVSATVANCADRSRGVRVVLRASRAEGGRELGASTPTIGANGRATLSFTTSLAEVGVHRLEVALVDESFTPDDVGRAVVNVAEARRIVMVTHARAGDMGSAAYFWEAALAPDERSAYRVVRVPPEDFAAGTLEGATAAVVVEAGAIPQRTIEMLRRFASAGDGIVWVADSSESSAGLAALTEGTGLFTSVGGLREVGEGLGIGDVSFDRAAMMALVGPLEMALRSVRFGSVCASSVGSAGVVLARLESRDAWLMEGPIGEGRLLSIHSALDPTRSTLVKSPVFPVLVGEIAGMIASAEGRARDSFVGEPVTVEITEPFEGALRDERGGIARVADESGGRVRASIEPLAVPGFVGVVDGAGKEVGVGAAGIDPRESDMRTMSDDEIRAVLSGAALAGAGGQGRAGGAVLGRRRPVELWGWLMAGAVVLLGVEGLVASSRGRARERARSSGRTP